MEKLIRILKLLTIFFYLDFVCNSNVDSKSLTLDLNIDIEKISEISTIYDELKRSMEEYQNIIKLNELLFQKIEQKSSIIN